MTGIFFHKRLISKPSSIYLDTNSKHIEINNRMGRSLLTFEELESVFIRSTYNGSYTSADKLTNEEYDIIIGVVDKSGKELNLFFYKSNFREPNQEIVEVHDYLRAILRG